MSCQGGLRRICIIPSSSQLEIPVNNKIACSLVCFALLWGGRRGKEGWRGETGWASLKAAGGWSELRIDTVLTVTSEEGFCKNRLYFFYTFLFHSVLSKNYLEMRKTFTGCYTGTWYIHRVSDHTLCQVSAPPFWETAILSFFFTPSKCKRSNKTSIFNGRLWRED